MTQSRRRFSVAFKVKVAMAALSNLKTLTELSEEYEEHPVMISKWKSELQKNASGIFTGEKKSAEWKEKKKIDELYRQIGQQKVEIDWMKKKLRADKNLIEKIDKNHPRLSTRRQAELLGIQRSNIYYKHRVKAEDDLYKEKKLDIREDPKMLSYGVRRMARELRRQGIKIGRKRTKRLMKELRIKAIYCRPKTSIPNKEHLKYQYLLKNKEIKNPNEVWSTDITYIKTKKGYLYLTAIIDWHSRYILSWELSTTMEKEFCIQTLEKALNIATPEIFNSDQGVQYTNTEHTDILKKNGIKISMDGKERCLDNVFIERFWRSIKYEYLNLKEYELIQELYADIKEYIDWYNKKRLHQSLGYKTPYEIYYKNQNFNLAL